jgi:D-sedoheptulose 7-phosphate isomerase
MPMLEQRIQQQFFDSADLKYAAAEILAKPISDAVSAIVGCITGGGKVLACGNGGSASDAQHFAAEFVGRFERERPGLAALALTTDTSILTAIGNDYDFNVIFSKQVQALGSPGDVLLAMTTSGNSANVLAAVDAAHAKEMTVIALTGRGGGKIREQLTETDVHICVPHERTARIQEVHLLTLHCICDAVDLQLLGEQDNT